MIRLQCAALLILALGLGACERPPPKSDQPPTEHNCPGDDPTVFPVVVNYENPNITVAGPNPDPFEGDVLRFNLVGADNVLVSTSGKEAKDGWLNGSGKKKPGKPASTRFFICIPTDLFEGDPKKIQEKEFGYNVNAVGKPELDPVVTIRRL